MTLTALTPRTLTSKRALQRDLEASEARGWFLNREETVEDSMTISGRFVLNGATFVVTIAGSLKPMERALDRAAKQLLATLTTLGSLS